jgi:hypothetical protein
MASLTPGAWLERLSARLDARWTMPVVGWGSHDAYFEGDHRLAFATGKFREAFGSLFGPLADNWMPLVVESKVERLKVQGFLFGQATSGDEAAWDIWQANNLDSEADMAHTEAAKLGEAYWLVQPARGDDPPQITVEHPSQFIVACDPANRRRRLAALKKWVGEDGFVYANVYLPDEVYKYKSQRKAQAGQRVEWARRQDDPGGPNTLREVPGIPIPNAPSLLQGGVSDLKVAEPVQDAVNKLLADMLIGAEYQAFPQRVLLGLQLPTDPQTGQPTRAAQLQASQQRVWTIPNPDGKIAEFRAADLDNYVNARQHLIRGLTAKTRTPPHYVLGEIVNASGDALKAAETGLVAKVRKAMPGDSARAAESRAEVIWADPESRTEGELTDAMLKQQTLGIPQEVLWRRLGYSETEIGRMKAMNMADELLNPPPPPPPADGPVIPNAVDQNGQPVVV